nr:DUF1836 domain-containing protein [Maliibacterium massiliense]
MQWEQMVMDQVAQLTDIDMVRAESIPQIDLYMEQVLAFFDKQLDPKRNMAETFALTKTMVNNYVKAGVLPPARKRKYGHDHMIRLLYVTLLKSVLSIQEIGQMLALTPDASDPAQQERTYEVFRQMVDGYRAWFHKHTQHRIEQVHAHLAANGPVDVRQEQMLFLALTAMEATAQKALCVELLKQLPHPQKPAKK